MQFPISVTLLDNTLENKKNEFGNVQSNLYMMLEGLVTDILLFMLDTPNHKPQASIQENKFVIMCNGDISKETTSSVLVNVKVKDT